MNTSNKITNKPSNDPFDQLIFERGLRAKHLLLDKELDLLLVVLNNAKIVKLPLSDYPRLYNASEQQLNDWKFIGGGVAIEWEQLDEDLSLKGFIKKVAMRTITGNLEDDMHKIVA
jgi:hypothetical protein